MKLKTSVPTPSFPFKIAYQDNLLAMGSCFAEHIGGRLKDHLFNISINPFGICYHPLPLLRGLNRLIENRPYSKEELFEHNELFHSYDHHSQFSYPSADEALLKINAALEKGHQRLMQSKCLLITLGTSWAYWHRDQNIYVANCHKVPKEHFEKRLTSIKEMRLAWTPVLTKLFTTNPKIKLIFSVSPVRHIKDGIHNNQISKSQLLLLTEQLRKSYEAVYYFPAYEIMMDELRDYRFYESDLLHPNQMAQDYIWQFFQETVFEKGTANKIEAVAKVVKASNHKPFHPGLESHQEFLQAQLKKIKRLQQEIPAVNFSKLEKKFSEQLI